MGKLFAEKLDSGQQAREALRRRKWNKAVPYFEKRAQESDRDAGLWNTLGDVYLSAGSRAQAAEAWRRALEIHALEGLHENVLGIARKILRRMPENEDVHLLLAEAYLGLEYHADCLAAVRGYLKAAKQRSEPDLRALLRKIMALPMKHHHLLEELKSIYRDTAIEDIELERQLAEFVAEMEKEIGSRERTTPLIEVNAQRTDGATDEQIVSEAHGLVGLEGLPSLESAGDDFGTYPSFRETPDTDAPDFSSDFEVPAAEKQAPAGESKDHYDLGTVYKEMKLWDAAITEFEQARQDPALRFRATIAFAECLQETHDLQGALELLESERQLTESSPHEHINVLMQIGAIHELLGNLDEALAHYQAVREQNAAYGDVEERIAELRGRLDANTEDHQ
jgi:tetratricopeptide (TPR) repeat protein